VCTHGALIKLNPHIVQTVQSIKSVIDETRRMEAHQFFSNPSLTLRIMQSKLTLMITSGE
jgi:hypothetical protein